MIIPRVWADEQGASHFADLDLPEAMMPTALGLPDMRSTGSIPTQSFRLITTTPQAMARGWHPAPARQFVIVVKGAITCQCQCRNQRVLLGVAQLRGGGNASQDAVQQRVSCSIVTVSCEKGDAVAPEALDGSRPDS